MPDIPAATLIGYIGTIFFLFGSFLILAGLGVIQIQQITVSKGVGTLATGFVIAVVGGVLIFSDLGKTKNEPIQETLITPTSPALTGQISPTLDSVFATSQPSHTQEIVDIELGDEIAVLNGMLTISLDFAPNENSIQISVRSQGYQRQTFEGLSIGDKVVFHGSSDYEIAITDFRVVSGFLSTHKIQVVVKTFQSSESALTPTAAITEIITIKSGEEQKIFNGEIIIEFSNTLFGYQIKVRSTGYVSQTYIMGIGSKFKYEGKYTYLMTITNYDTNTGLELRVSK